MIACPFMSPPTPKKATRKKVTRKKAVRKKTARKQAKARKTRSVRRADPATVKKILRQLNKTYPAPRCALTLLLQPTQMSSVRQSCTSAMAEFAFN